MIDRFPRTYDPQQFERLRRLYGDRVPAFDRIRVRHGLHWIVDSLFAALGRLPTRNGPLRILRIETRRAGLLDVVTSGAAAGAGDILADAEQAARTTCEHCGGSARLVVKVGLEALRSHADLEPIDRLLCLDCADQFQKDIFEARS